MTLRNSLAAVLAASVFTSVSAIHASPAEAAASAMQSEAPASQAVLEATLADLRTGDPDTSNFSEELAEAVTGQQAMVDQFFAEAGAVTDIAYQASQDGADLYLVEFENVRTIWAIGMEGETINALAFQQAPPAGAAGETAQP
jgi:hypothetical protein